MTFIRLFLQSIIIYALGFVVLSAPAFIIEAVTDKHWLVTVYLILLLIALVAKDTCDRIKQDKED